MYKMARYAVINTKLNKVVNVIEYNGTDRFYTPANCILKQSDIANTNDLYDGLNIIPQGE